MTEDWDNLLILDACRYDLFESEHTLDGRLENRRSMAASTVEFLKTNVDGKDLTDTVYVTANGQIRNHQDEIDAQFHRVVPLYADGWDPDLGTVPPDAVTDAVVEAAEEYPRKRLLVHYVQPHFPFIGADTEADKARTAEKEYEHGFWMRVFSGEVDMTREELWEAYERTFELALPEVARAIDHLQGKTVVTADHGNLFGERARPIPIREWGHPMGVYIDELVRVPWFICEHDARREITPDPPREQELKSDPAAVADRLEAMGYKQ